ncbi:MAG: hypothetical protein LBD75_06945 [Candidatus Peribacteria bacterium]|jgi:F0F1-type ATP synthase membrane subunit b/b'|nr:hypothetical protein [Candidatus Peribacteria bacterium]
MDTVVNSGADMLSGVWNTTKEVSKDFYEEQIKPTVDTAIDATQQEMERLKQEAKNQVNSGIDQAGQKFSNRMQEKADTIKDKIGDLKIE